MLLNRTFTFILASIMILVLTATSLGKEIEGNARVSGKICGTDVKLTTAKFDGSILEIYEGDGWGFNPSMLIFLFDNGKLVAPKKSIKIEPSSKKMAPHIHSRFKVEGQKHVEMADIAMKDYSMSIRFQQVKRGFLPAKFKISIPEQDTELEGFFFLKQEKDGK